MTTHRLSSGSTGSPPPRPGMNTNKSETSWTDDLPVCHLSGVGFATNQIYREDGFRREEHEFEDRSIHVSLDEGMYLYGVFDGHDGSRASNFTAQRMPAEILLGQIGSTTEDSEVQEVLRQAFVSVEKGYFDSIDDILAEKANQQLQIPEGVTAENLYEKCPELYKQLQAIDAELSGGCTAVVGLVFHNKLFVANVGCARALFCKHDAQGNLRVVQLSADHILSNEDELNRLAVLGVDIDQIKKDGQIGNHSYTRTIGDYHIKGNYKEVKGMSSATAEPLVCEPEVYDPIDLTDTTGFLILMSFGLFKSWKDATGSEHVNTDIASMTATAFNEQTTLNGVAQAVVDKVVRIHHDTYMTSSNERKELCETRKDITLLVRNFNYPLPNAVHSPTMSSPLVGIGTGTGTYPPFPVGALGTMDQPLSVVIPKNKAPPDMNGALLMYPNNETNSSTYRSSVYTSTYSSNDSTQSGDGSKLFSRTARTTNPLELDADGRIQPYIDFTDFFKTIEALTDEERQQYEIQTELKPAYEPIMEEETPETPPEQSKPLEVEIVGETDDTSENTERESDI